MTPEIVIDIATLGSAEALHFDEFDLGFLGAKRIARASHILFDAEAQRWCVAPVGGALRVNPALSGFVGYDEARRFEVAWLQACRKGDLAPESPEGLALAASLREAA